MMNNLKGTIGGPCKCGKCSVPSYPGRLYDKEWSCEKKAYIKSYIFEYQLYLKDFSPGKTPDYVDVKPDYNQPLSYSDFSKLIRDNPQLAKRFIDIY